MMFWDEVEAFFALRSLQQENLELWGKLFGFDRPVAGDRGWRDDKCWAFLGPATTDLRLDMAKCLEGFAQAHVVGEDAVEGMAGEKLHPMKAIGLVVPQFGGDRFWDGGFGQGGDAFEFAPQFGESTEGVRSVDIEAFGEVGGLDPVERFVWRGEAEEVVDGLGEGEKPLGVDGDKASAFGIAENRFVVFRYTVDGLLENCRI